MNGIDHIFRNALPFLWARGSGRSAPADPVREAEREALAHQLNQASSDDLGQALLQLSSHTDGLSAPEAAERLARVGPNEVAHQKARPWWAHLADCYANPFNLLLTVLAALSWLTDDPKATLVIATMVLLSTVVRFLQEGRSSRTADRLKAMVSRTALVLRRDIGNEAADVAAQYFDVTLHGRRPPRQTEVQVRDLVPGDHLVLSAGDMIPADCRVMTAKDLFVAQAAITGESLPVEKFSDRRGQAEGPLEQSNLVFMGTHVVSGSATALVVHTGSATAFGDLAWRVTANGRAQTAFQAGVNSVSWLLIRFAAVMVPLVLVVNGLTKGDWPEAFMFALSVAVGLTPEMLPMIVTSTLAKGAVALARKKVIVKRLDAIQNFGAMDVLCTDKTGTLTHDRIALARHTDPFGQHSTQALRLARLNSLHQTGLKNVLDRALLDHPVDANEPTEPHRKVDEIPFDFERRRMSVVVADAQDRHLLVCKGALEEMLAVCTHVRTGAENDPQDLPLDPAMRDRVTQAAERLNGDGLRVLAVASRSCPSTASRYTIADEAGLTLVGHVAFLDAPKASTAPALRALAERGVRVKVLTGDNPRVTARVCTLVGLPADAILLGPEIDRLADADLALAVESRQVFAKLTPAHKERVVSALRANGHVVGFMGDGINDAPALRCADIGISVDSAVDIAKEAADIILLEKSLMVLEAGVVEGRKTFANMLKYIRMTASSNFGNVFSVLVASAFLPFLPMLPLQLLVQNLLYDISQIAIPFDKVDPELIEKPITWNPRDIGRFMVFFGPISSVFDILTFALMWFVFRADTSAHQGLFQSGWFVVGLLTQTLIVHLIRTPKLPFIESRAAPFLLVMTAAIVAIGLWLPNGPLAGDFKLQALPGNYYPWLIAILFGYCALASAMKRLYVRRFGWQSSGDQFRAMPSSA